jgi:hypothetical protein
MASVAAFDLAAANYDFGFGRTAAARVFRHVFQECLLQQFRAGSRLRGGVRCVHSRSWCVCPA